MCLLCFLCNVNVLILHQHFNTPEQGGALRSYYLAKGLVENGIQPVVITGRGQTRYEVVVFEGIEIHYLPVAYDNRFGFWGRGKAFLDYVRQSVVTCGNIKKEFAWCYAISVPLTVGIAAMLIKRLHRIPFLFEVGDLWPEAPIELGFIRNSAFKKLLFGLEKRIYREAQSLVALSPAIKTNLEQKAPDKTVHLISNMSDTEYFRPSPKDNNLEKKYDVENKFVISYVGAAGFANGLEYFVKCALLCQAADLPIHFILSGDGATLKGLIKEADEKKLKNLTFTGHLNRAAVRDVMNITDASFICYRPATILESGAPNKYFDALAAGKLIIINFGGWIEEEISREQCGIRLHDESELIFKVLPFTRDRSHLVKYQAASRALAENKYSRRRLSNVFAGLFDSGL